MNVKTKEYPTYVLDMNRLNEPMRDGFIELLNAAKRARWTNASTRKDGVETPHEADWIKLMTIAEGEDEYELRRKYPAVQDAYEKYITVLELVKENKK